MTINPFTLRIVSSEDDFCNRRKEIEELSTYARGGNNVVLFSPRRYGKSSLVAVVRKKMAQEGFATVYADLFPVTSENDLAARLSSALIQGLGKGVDPRSFLEKAKNLFGRIRPKIEMTAEGMSLSADMDSGLSPGVALEELMRGVGKYVAKNKLRCLVALDEFQEITELPESKKIEGILRSHIQFHRDISYFFIGSRRRLLKDMFTLKNRPFYKSAFLYSLEKIPRNEFVSFLQRRFRKTGKECPEQVASSLYDAVAGYPYYVQKLASLLWDQTEKAAGGDSLKSAYRTLIQTEIPDFEGYWSGLTVGQRSLLKALALSPTPEPYARDYLKRFDLSLGGTQKALKVLLERDLVEKTNEGFLLTDPVMAAWLGGKSI